MYVSNVIDYLIFLLLNILMKLNTLVLKFVNNRKVQKIENNHKTYDIIFTN